MGVILGFKVKNINLTIAGFNIEFVDSVWNSDYKKRIKSKLLIDIGGPVVNLLFIIFGVIFKEQEIIYSNTIIFLVNIFPILPLDGGRIVKDFLELKYNFRTVNHLMIEISKYHLVFLTLLASVLIVYLNNVFIGIFILYLWCLFLKEKRESMIVEKLYRIMNRTNKLSLMENSRLKK